MMIKSELLDVKISRRRDEAEGIVSIEVVPVSGGDLPAFEGGSHVDFYIAPGLIRQYSICSDPRETRRYVFGILLELQSRGGSAAIHKNFVEGYEFQISLPRNNFKLIESAGKSILAGGGIGITPALAMAWRLHAIGAPFELHYCTRSLARTAFTGLLETVPFADRVFLHLDDGPPEQRLDVNIGLANPGVGKHLYICGPGGFMDYVIGSAKRLGWAEDHVHVEYFAAEVDVTGDAFMVRAARSGLTLTVPAGQSIAEVLEAHGVEVPVSCAQGVCGSCLTGVIDGIPDHRDFFLTEGEKAANKQMTPCCSRSKTPLLVLDI